MQELYQSIDMHCHILPGIDDGAETMEMALDMLKVEVEQGTKEVVLTPHFYLGNNRYTSEELEERFKQLCQQVNEQEIDIKLHLGNEILWTDGVLEALKKGEAHTIAGTEYVLVEFYPATSWQVIEKAVRSLTLARYIPILAHFERYGALREEEHIEELKEYGALFQMNYASIEGRKGFLKSLFNDSYTTWCRTQVLSGNVDFFGTDAHNMKTRTPERENALTWLKKHADKQEIMDILYKNPKKLL